MRSRTDAGLHDLLSGAMAGQVPHWGRGSGADHQHVGSGQESRCSDEHCFERSWRHRRQLNRRPAASGAGEASHRSPSDPSRSHSPASVLLSAANQDTGRAGKRPERFNGPMPWKPDCMKPAGGPATTRHRVESRDEGVINAANPSPAHRCIHRRNEKKRQSAWPYPATATASHPGMAPCLNPHKMGRGSEATTNA